MTLLRQLLLHVSDQAAIKVQGVLLLFDREQLILEIEILVNKSPRSDQEFDS